MDKLLEIKKDPQKGLIVNVLNYKKREIIKKLLKYTTNKIKTKVAFSEKKPFK